MDDDARPHDAGPPHRRDDPAKDPSTERADDRGGDPVPTDPAPAAGGRDGDDPMEHRFAADEEVADGGAAGADEARTPGMGA
jgi:hypothetical protein